MHTYLLRGGIKTRLEKVPRDRKRRRKTPILLGDERRVCLRFDQELYNLKLTFVVGDNGVLM